MQHWQETGHPVGVKLGTITPEGTGGGYETRVVCRIAHVADIYCYACDDAKVDPELANHLHTFGIEVMGQTKTEKSMTELVSTIPQLKVWTALIVSSNSSTTSSLTFP